jgi:hypothetical protein
VRNIGTWLRSNSHYLVTAVLLATLLPLLKLARFPIRWDNTAIMAAYLGGSLQSVVLAALLYAISYPTRIWEDKAKLALTLGLAAVLFAVYGFVVASLFFTCATLLPGRKLDWRRIPRCSIAPLMAYAYLFLGLVLSFTFVSIIIRFRFYGIYDAFFNDLDRSMLGVTVDTMARDARALPADTFRFLDFVYYGMFAQIGAALIICLLSSGRRRAMQFVGTILTCYYLALVIFLVFPSIGPFAPDTAISTEPLDSYAAQKYMVQNAKYIWEQNPVTVIPIGYYISFPCMHIAQPVVVLWFLRKWKRMVFVLCIYDILLVAAILLLRWHYFVDILGGVAVAIAALLIVKEPSETTAPLDTLSVSEPSSSI